MPRKNEKTTNKQRQRIIKTKKDRMLSGYYDKIRFCVYCKKELHYSQKKFCCTKCFGLSMSGKNHPMYKDGNSTKKKKCSICDSLISVRSKTNLCRSCYVKHNKGKNHPAWKNGVSKSHCIICNEVIGGSSTWCRKCFDKSNQRSIIQSKKWKEQQYAMKQLQLIQKGLNTIFNVPERKLSKLLHKLFPKEYKFVGDGKVWIVGKNPDFINVNGQKKIIELFGDYWHSKKITGKKKKEHRIQRQKHFANYGYKTLVVWEHELKTIPALKKKLVQFHGVQI